MAKLVLHGDEGVQREIPLDKQRVTIGRSSSNDICMDDKATSSQHAAVITIGRNCYLQDLKSTNGTLVNGSPVQKHTLKHGDVILIGRNHISYLDEPESSPATTSSAPENAGAANNDAAPALAASLPKPAATAAAPAFDPTATLQQGPEKDVANDRGYEPWAVKNDGAPPKDMVDSMLDAIRSHREQERTIEVRRKDKVDAEWKKLIEAAQVLKKRVAGHPRVKFFDISRNHGDIMIRLQRDDSKTQQHSILISRTHPHNPSPLETIWLIETGRLDKHCDNCEDIMRDLMITLAPLIA
jgi:pSer/pThr/pTyr-binding forkhead associated (FHA) protein